MFETIDFKSGEVHYCVGCLEEEDILLVEFPKNYILELGWYGESTGFILNIVRDSAWGVPVVKYYFSDKNIVENVIRKAVDRIEEEIKTARPYYGSLWTTEEIVIDYFL